MKKLLFNSIGIALCIFLVASCTRKPSKTVEGQEIPVNIGINSGAEAAVEKKPVITSDSMPVDPKETGKTNPPKSTKPTKENVIEKPKIEVKKTNDYNTKGPNQSKIDSIKAAKAKGKFNK